MLTKHLLRLILLCALLAPVASVHADTDRWDYKPRMIHVPILMYHYISAPPAGSDKVRDDLSVTPDNFQAQVTWLKTHGYTSITPDDLIGALWQGKKLPPKPVMLTFDDGYVDAYDNAFPILKAAGFTGTFFVITDFVDRAGGGYLNWAMAKEMVDAGMYIQSHSRTHEMFVNRTHDWYVNEIVEPMQDIAAHTGVTPRFFCYPDGRYDNVAIRELRNAGFVAAFTENDSRYEFASNTMRLPRVRVRGAMTLDQFVRTLTDNR